MAEELAARYLLDQIEITADTSGLDLNPLWRGTLNDRILEGTGADTRTGASTVYVDTFQRIMESPEAAEAMKFDGVRPETMLMLVEP
ncbi:MAG: hypothetical protein NTU93_00625 [Arthrobacter sp.]|nr:hypothetical protein [Arthrobacter sp.]